MMTPTLRCMQSSASPTTQVRPHHVPACRSPMPIPSQVAKNAIAAHGSADQIPGVANLKVRGIWPGGGGARGGRQAGGHVCGMCVACVEGTAAVAVVGVPQGDTDGSLCTCGGGRMPGGGWWLWWLCRPWERAARVPHATWCACSWLLVV